MNSEKDYGKESNLAEIRKRKRRKRRQQQMYEIEHIDEMLKYNCPAMSDFFFDEDDLCLEELAGF